MEQLILFFLVFGAVAIMGYVLIGVFAPQKGAVALRLESLGSGAAAEAVEEGQEESASSAKKKSLSLLMRIAQKIGVSAGSRLEGEGDETSHRLAMAGYSAPNYISTYQGTRLMIAAGAACAGSLVMLITDAPAGKILLAAVVGFLLGMILPNFYLSILIKKRQEKISAALPNMVDLLVVCVEAGLGLDLAMSRVGQELSLSSPELSRELNALGRELSAGQSHEHALSRLAWRIGIGDVENLVSMLIQAERFGTSIAVSLRVFSDSFRTARRQRIEEAAAKTTVKLLFPLIFFIFPAIFVILLGPAVVNVMTKGIMGN